jgi:hypothetical protein
MNGSSLSILVMAFEVPYDTHDIDIALNNHSHKVIGEFLSRIKAIAAVKKYISEWKKVPQLAIKCECKDINLDNNYFAPNE